MPDVSREFILIGFASQRFFFFFLYYLIIIIFFNLQVLAPKSFLPFVRKLIPITSVSRFEVSDEPYNNLRNSDMLLEGMKGSEKRSITVFDSHYMDLTGYFLLIFSENDFT